MDGQEPDSKALSRRALFRLGAVTAGASALAILADQLGSDASRATAFPVASPSTANLPPAQVSTPTAPHWQSINTVAEPVVPPGIPTPTATPTILPGPLPPSSAPTPPVRMTEPTWVHTWDSPIYRLDDFTHRSPSTHYGPGAIMLTIDDGPDDYYTPKYLRLLAKYHVQATFCVIGRQVKERAKLVKATASEGHHIANHTYNHPLNLPFLTAKRIHAEIEDTTDAIVRASGFHPRQFRAPGGVWGKDVFEEVARQQMMPLGWDIDPRDWSLPGVEHIRSAMLAARPHDIILCHDGGGNRSETYAALETVIPALLHRGWHFVTLPAPATV